MLVLQLTFWRIDAEKIGEEESIPLLNRVSIIGGQDQTLAYVEEGSKQEFIASLGAVLRIGSDRIDVPREYSFLSFPRVRDRTENGST